MSEPVKTAAIPWTDEELAFLEANWPTMTVHEMADALNRSANSIVLLKSKRGWVFRRGLGVGVCPQAIPAPSKPKGFSRDQVAYAKAHNDREARMIRAMLGEDQRQRAA